MLYDFVPIAVPTEIADKLPSPISDITAISWSNDDLCVCFQNSQFCSFPIKNFQKIQIPDEIIASSFADLQMYPYQVKPFMDQLLYLLRSKDEEQNILAYIDSNGDVLEVKDDVECFAVDEIGGHKNVCAFISNGNAYVFQYNIETNDFSQLFSLEENEKFLDIAISFTEQGKYLFVVGPNSKRIINLTNGTVQTLSNGNSNPSIFAFSPRNFCEISLNIAVKFTADFRTENSSVNLGEFPIDNAMFGNFAVSLLPNSIAAYDFVTCEHGLPIVKTVSLKDARCMTVFKGHLFVGTAHGVYLISNISKAVKDFRDRPHAVASSLESTEPEYVAAFFDYIWTHFPDDHEKAIGLFKLEPFRRIMYLILEKIYAGFFFQREKAPHENQFLPNITQISNDHAFLTMVYGKLKECRQDASEAARRAFNSAIIECLALSYSKDDGEMEAFLSEKPELETLKLRGFVDSVSNQELKMILLEHFSRIEDALNYFIGLDKSEVTDTIVTIVSRLILIKARDWDVIEPHITKVMESDPVAGVGLLADDQMDITKSTTFINDRYPQLSVLFSLRALHHPNQTAKRSLVNSIASELRAALMKTSSESFEPSDIPYLKCVLRGDATVDDCVAELSEEIHGLVVGFPKELDANELVRHASQFPPALRGELFVAAGRYEDAVNSLWAVGAPLGDETLRETIGFCRKCNDPGRVFGVLIERLKADRDVDTHKALAAILPEIVDGVIDVAPALTLLDADAPFAEASALIERLYRLLVNSRLDAQIDSSFATAEEFESKYRRAKLQSGCMTLHEDSTCSRCGKPLGFQYVQCDSNGNLYHFGCADSD